MTFDLSPLTLRKDDHHNTPQQQMDKLPQEYPKSSLQLHSTTDLQFTIGLTVALEGRSTSGPQLACQSSQLQSLASIGAALPEIRAFKRGENSRSTSSQGGGGVWHAAGVHNNSQDSTLAQKHQGNVKKESQKFPFKLENIQL